jgi:hypothetical protein
MGQSFSGGAGWLLGLEILVRRNRTLVQIFLIFIYFLFILFLNYIIKGTYTPVFQRSVGGE